MVIDGGPANGSGWAADCAPLCPGDFMQRWRMSFSSSSACLRLVQCLAGAQVPSARATATPRAAIDVLLGAVRPIAPLRSPEKPFRSGVAREPL
jgi:hypothetical protein